MSTSAPDGSFASLESNPTKLTPEDIAVVYHDILDKYKRLILVLGIGYSIIFLLSAILVIHMRRTRSDAHRGDSKAARKIILPAFMPLLQLLMFLSFAYALYFGGTRFLDPFTRFASAVETEAYGAGRIFFILVPITFMMQKSVTKPALQRAIIISILLSAYTIPVVWFAQEYLSLMPAYWVEQAARMLLLLVFVWGFAYPPARASRTTIREYCVYVFIYYALLFVSGELLRNGHLNAGFTTIFANILWGSFCPLVIWRLLRADTEHWRGLGQRAFELQAIFRQKNRMDERISSRGLHVLIEMHRKYIIDFAYLELRTKIGDGSSAVVFNGMLRSKTAVAIKVYTPTELTDEVVAEFSHEAALCGALHHPNIVRFFGMCVCPPTICLVFELCQGSLREVTKALAHRAHSTSRRQFMINLNYMIDATRAVAYLHSFSPAFVHRDIKPSNFLIDRRSVVKLTDFGESRSLPHARGGAFTANKGSNPVGMSPSTTESATAPSHDVQASEDALPMQSGPRNAMTVRGTAEYMAPEIIQGKAGQAIYGEAADIFSLTMTLWDIMHPLEDKYPSSNGNHFQVFEAVLSGRRPVVCANFHPQLWELFELGWSERPESRPSALFILNTLQQIQQTVCSDIGAEMLSAMDNNIVIDKNGCITEGGLSGHRLVQTMIESGFVDSVAEAIRAGNGLMSSGLLHHSRHALGFDNTEELFAFDDARLQVVQKCDEQVDSPYAKLGARLSTTLGPVEDMSVDAPIEQTHAQLFHFRSRRKNPEKRPGDRRRLSASITSVAASSTTVESSNIESDGCLCMQIGAGMTCMPKRTHRRFRIGRKGPTSGAATDVDLNDHVDGSEHGGAKFGWRVSTGMDGQTEYNELQAGAGSTQRMEDDNSSLTAKLLVNEFSLMEENAYTDSLLESPCPHSLVVDVPIQDDLEPGIRK